MPKTLKILLADDHPIFRDGVRRVLEADPRNKVVAECGDGHETLARMRELKAELLVVDIDMPGVNGLELARLCQREQWPAKVVFLTMHADQEMLNEALDLGVSGYVLKETAAAELRDAIARIAAGERYISGRLSRFLLERREAADTLRKERPGLDQLTPTERRILKLVASDRTSKEMADELGVSPRTVENHRASICAKLGLTGAHSLVKFAFENRSKL